MDQTIPWYQSAIVRQQIAQIVVALTALVGIKLGAFDVDATLQAIFAGIAALIGVWTLLTRIFKPAPNLSVRAVNKEVELVNEKKIPPSPTGPARGFFRPAFAFVLAACAALLSIAVLSGCAGTTGAYKAAKSLPDTAYVVTEHYAAVVKEAADLAQLPGTPDNVKAALKRADQVAKPLVLGDPALGLPSLEVLAKRYQEVRDAKTEADLSAAVTRAVEAVAQFINAVKAARS